MKVKNAMQLLKMKDVIRVTGLSWANIYKLISEEQFPASYKLSTRRVGWKKTEIDQWIDTRPISKF